MKVIKIRIGITFPYQGNNSIYESMETEMCFNFKRIIPIKE